MKVSPLTPGSDFGAEILGVDLHVGATEEEFAVIRGALDQFSVVVVRDQIKDGQVIGEEEQLRFARQFGPLDHSYIPKSAVGSQNSRPGYGEVSNLDDNGEFWTSDSRRRWFLLANLLWHSDTSYKPIPSWVTLLTAHVVPPGQGQTEFADMRAAWDDLPPETKARIQGLSVEHSIFHSRGQVGFTDFSDEDRAAAPPAAQPLVRINPRSGRKSLYLSAHASHVIGWPPEESKELLDELTEFATQPKYVYSHDWRVGDVVAWDNGSTMHRATPFDEFKHKRIMKRTGINELGPVVPAFG
jgi:alpha-ketoglutarate-dependent 2,4-dichlorophenoxyacetate dioxygenase